LKTRKLGNSSLNLTTIGMDLANGWLKSMWLGPQDDQDSITSIRRVWKGGINWIDTAPNYGNGHSEEVSVWPLKEYLQSRLFPPNVFYVETGWITGRAS